MPRSVQRQTNGDVLVFANPDGRVCAGLIDGKAEAAGEAGGHGPRRAGHQEPGSLTGTACGAMIYAEEVARSKWSERS